MRFHTPSLVLSVIASCGGPAAADLVVLGADDATVVRTGADSVAKARYRVSATNWDQAIITSNTVTNATIAASGGLGNSNQLNGALWELALHFDPQVGLTWSLIHVGGGSPQTNARTLSWTAPFNGRDPFASHNAIELYVKAGPSMPNGVTGASIQVSDLTFTAAGYAPSGALTPLSATWSPNGGGSDLTRWIVADGDLAATSWTLTGRVLATWSGTGNPNLDERIRLDVALTSAVLIPAPSAAVLLAGLAVGRRRRR